MMFLIVFNMCVFVVDNLHIYNMSGYKDDAAFNPSGDTFYKEITISILEGALFTIATATIFTALTKSFSDAGIAYSFLSGVFWPMALRALAVIQNIGEGNLGSSMIVMIFAVILVFVWAAGLLQMVRGGWKTYE
jgi:hypothetical protein